jgi:DNA-directed RNA polymerase specialized sigma24 family protein
MTALDSTFLQVRSGNRTAFAEWMGNVEIPIRLTLRPFAQAVDVESVVQETLLRMWILSQDTERELTGENASLRFAIGVARNIARAEARRFGNEKLLPPEEVPEGKVDPEAPSDAGLRKAILECVNRLARRPAQAFHARLQGGPLPDGKLASRLGMTLNTFLQNTVRARNQLAECLARKGVPLQEFL